MQEAATPLHVIQAFQKANKAQEGWQKADRVTILKQITSEIIKAGENQALIKTIAEETGKPAELVRSQDFVFAAQSFETVATDITTQATKTSHYRASYGVAVLITPISTPFSYLAQKLSVMIGAGNTVVIKPSSHTPKTAKILEDILKEAKVPEGVVNFIYGKGEELSEILLTHPTVDFVQIGARPATITKVKKMMAPTQAKLNFDSGSKNAALILNDADLQQTAETIATAWLSDAGFNIYAPQRIFIDEKLEPEFFELLKTTSESFLRRHFSHTKENAFLKTGHNYDEFNKAIAQITTEKGDAIALAHESLIPMHRPPSIVRDLTDCSDIHQREVLGPIITIRGFKYPFDGVKWANTTENFKVASIFSKDKDRSIKLAQTLKTPLVHLNSWPLAKHENLDDFQVAKIII